MSCILGIFYESNIESHNDKQRQLFVQNRIKAITQSSYISLLVHNRVDYLIFKASHKQRLDEAEQATTTIALCVWRTRYGRDARRHRANQRNPDHSHASHLGSGGWR